MTSSLYRLYILGPPKTNIYSHVQHIYKYIFPKIHAQIHYRMCFFYAHMAHKYCGNYLANERGQSCRLFFGESLPKRVPNYIADTYRPQAIFGCWGCLAISIKSVEERPARRALSGRYTSVRYRYTYCYKPKMAEQKKAPLLKKEEDYVKALEG